MNFLFAQSGGQDSAEDSEYRLAEETSEIGRLTEELNRRLSTEVVHVFYGGWGQGATIAVHSDAAREKVQAALSVIQPRCKVQIVIP